MQLGDTRHIAMISLAVSGSSPTICRELAGHDNISISSHYYTNLTEFLDVLGYERYREIKTTYSKEYGIKIDKTNPVKNGYCQCVEAWNGNYSACVSAVDEIGIPGSCEVCKWYAPKGTMLSIKLPDAVASQQPEAMPSKQRRALELQQTCTLLKQAVDQVRQGLGNTETLSCMLDRLAAQSQHFIHQAVLERLIAESEEI